ncbi:MAG: hypothetical protein RL624_162 [Bacteroidota bacterium]|jgi:large subunit ribosomal protein L18
MTLDQKVIRRQKLRWRIRRKVSGTASKPRLSVFRSNRDIYVQLIDDANGVTLVAASSRDKDISAMKTNKVEKALAVGKAVAQKAKAAGIENCVFDRGGYLYHGRVKSVADGAREGGLQF